MKQHITIKQLNQLSEKGKERLRKWFWKDEDREWGTYFITKNRFCGLTKEASKYIKKLCGESECIKGDCGNWFPNRTADLPVLSIGQLIEFLDEKTDLEEEQGFKVIGWSIELDLCDVLWEPVKEVLEH